MSQRAGRWERRVDVKVSITGETAEIWAGSSCILGERSPLKMVCSLQESEELSVEEGPCESRRVLEQICPPFSFCVARNGDPITLGGGEGSHLSTEMIEDTPVITTSDRGTSKEEGFKHALVQPLHQKQDISLCRVSG